MNRKLSDSVNQIKLSETFRNKLTDVLAEEQMQTKPFGVGFKRTAAAAAVFVLLAAALTGVSLHHQANPAVDKPAQTNTSAAEVAEYSLQLCLTQQHADGQRTVQPLKTGTATDAQGTQETTEGLVLYTFCALNTAEYDRIYIALRSSDAEHVQLLVGTSEEQSMAKTIFVVPEGELPPKNSATQFYVKKAEKLADENRDTAVGAASENSEFFLTCPKNGEAVYAVLAEKDAENTRTTFNLKLSATDGKVTAELLSEMTEQMNGDNGSVVPSAVQDAE